MPIYKRANSLGKIENKWKVKTEIYFLLETLEVNYLIFPLRDDVLHL